MSFHIFPSDKPHYPYELPKGWVWTTVGETCETHLGKMLDKLKNEGYYMSYLRNINVRWGCFDLTDVLKMRFKDDEVERYMIEKGDLVLCEGGEPGRCAIWDKANPIMFQKALHRIRCHGGVLNEYLKYVIEDYAKANKLEEYYTGSTIKHLTGESLVSILFPLPPVKEQERIVQEIQRYLSLVAIIENNKENLLAAIKQAKSKVLDLAIHGKLVPQDPNDEPAIELLKRINPKAEIISDNGHYQKIVPFEVPNKWKWCKLKDICTFLSRGKSPKYKDEDGTYPVFAQKCNLKDGGISLEQARFLDPDTLERWDEKYKLRNGDVLINSTGTGTVGRTRLFTEDCLDKYPFVVPDSHVSVVRTHVDVVSEFVYSYISSAHIQQYIEDNLAGSTNQKELYVGVLEEMFFPLPPLTEQKRIVSKIRSIFAQLDTIVATL